MEGISTDQPKPILQYRNNCPKINPLKMISSNTATITVERISLSNVSSLLNFPTIGKAIKRGSVLIKAKTIPLRKLPSSPS